MQSQKRSNCNFDTHELIITKNECCSVYQLKKPKTILDSIKFINTNGILAVTGDYGNWIFCREFHPSEDGFVSDGYWLEKLEIASSQDGREFSSELSKKQILDCLEEEGITEEEKAAAYGAQQFVSNLILNKYVTLKNVSNEKNK